MIGRGAGGFGGARAGALVAPQASQDLRRSLGGLLRRLRPERGRLWLVLLLGSSSVGFTVLGPKLLGDATNVIFGGLIGKRLPSGISQPQAIAMLRAHHERQLAGLVAGMPVTPGVGIRFGQLGTTLGLAALVYLLGAVLAWGQTYVMAGVAQRTMYRLRRDVEGKLARLPLRYFDSHAHGDILSRVTNDIDNLTTTVQQGLSQLVTSVLTILGVVVLMFTISPLLSVIALVTVPLSIAVTLLIARRSQRHFVTQWARTGSLNGHVEGTHTGHALVQVFGQRQAVISEFRRQNQELYQASFRAQFLSGIIQPAIQSLANLNYVLIAAIGGYQVVSGAISLGGVQAFIQYSRQFTMPITQIASQMNLLQSGLASAERVFEFLDAPEEVADPVASGTVREAVGRVALEHVSFSYRPDEPLITDFSLTVEPGQTIAIVGPTGAGKTTLVNLLMRFYDIDGGRILLDGTDARELTRAEVRQRFGMVLQDTWLFAGSIRDNIAYGREGSDQAAILAAARAAHVDGFVRTLPQGYDTVLDPDATNISAGQRQLLTIARAFLADPTILILDEATSNVDTRTEVLIQEAMTRLRQGRTSFVIAHRLSTIRGADTIIVMDRGRIVEQGNHADLLARGAVYHDLYQSQFTDAFAEAG